MSRQIADRLLKLKEEINQARLDQATAQGRLDENMDRLNTEFDCASVKAGQKKLDKLTADCAKLEQQVAKGLSDLESKYEW